MTTKYDKMAWLNEQTELYCLGLTKRLVWPSKKWLLQAEKEHQEKLAETRTNEADNTPTSS